MKIDQGALCTSLALDDHRAIPRFGFTSILKMDASLREAEVSVLSGRRRFQATLNGQRRSISESRAKTSSRLPTPLKNVSLEPLEPEELRRIVQRLGPAESSQLWAPTSPFANLRPLVVAPTLPPMVPTAGTKACVPPPGGSALVSFGRLFDSWQAWGGDRDDPFFQAEVAAAPSFETIGKPIRLKFCKEWYEDFFGSAAKSIPGSELRIAVTANLLDANNWLPPGTPVRLKLPSASALSISIESESRQLETSFQAEALPEVDHLESAPGLEVEAPSWEGLTGQLCSFSGDLSRWASALQAPSDLPHVAAKMEQLDGVDTANRPLPPPMDMPRMVSDDMSEPISGMPDCKDEMLEATEKVDRFAKVHFRAMVFIKFLGLLALASLLAVEWVSEECGPERRSA
ncbi:unnamed protein product [Effrenium voratum]|nr:unnamed protein product [Effrenium voratum]